MKETTAMVRGGPAPAPDDEWDFDLENGSYRTLKNVESPPVDVEEQSSRDWGIKIALKLL